MVVSRSVNPPSGADDRDPDTSASTRRGARGKGKVTPLHPNALHNVNPEAERNFLGSILLGLGEEAVEAALDLVRPADFTDDRHRMLCEAMQALRAEAKPAGDLVLLDEWLRQRGRLTEAGGQAYITSLGDAVKTANHVDDYARILVRLGAQRAGSQEIVNFFAGLGAPEATDAGSFEALWRRLATRMETQLDRLADAAPGAGDIYTAAELERMELPDTRWIVPDLLPVGLTLLAAKQKIGKSWWALSIALSGALGGKALGAKTMERGDVLYLALEDNERRMQARIAQLLQGERMPARLHIAHKWTRLDQGGYRNIEKWLREHPEARMVIIDVLAKVRTPRAKNGDIYAEDYALMTPLKDLADAYNVAIVVIHHTRKASAEDVFDEIRDSAGLTGACDAVMVLQRQRNDDSAVLHITGRDVDETQFALKFDKTSGQWNLLGDAAEYGLTEARREIRALLRKAKRPMTPMHIAESLGKNVSTIRNLLVKMDADSQVINHYNGTYSVDSVDSVDAIDSVDSVDALSSASTATMKSMKSTESTQFYSKNAKSSSEGVRSAVYAWAQRHSWLLIKASGEVIIEQGQQAWESWLRQHDTDTIAKLWETLQRIS